MAAGTAVWQDVDGDWDNTANWTGGSGTGGVPGSGNTVIIGSGSQDITTNLTTGLTGITLRIGPEYTGTIGSASTWLDIDCADVDYNSGGDSYLTGTWTTCTVVGTIASDNALQIRGNSSSDIGTLRILGGAGTVTVAANAVLDAVEVLSAPSSTLTIASGVTSLDTITMDSGSVSCGANMAGTVAVRGGLLTVTDSATIAALEIDSGTTSRGSVSHKSSGIITALTVYGGLFDGRDNSNSAATITAATLYDGAIDLRSGLDNYTISNGVAIRGGGALYAHPGSTLTIA